MTAAPNWMAAWWDHHLAEVIFWGGAIIFVLALVIVAVSMSARDWEDTAGDKKAAERSTTLAVRDEPSVYYEARRINR